MKHLTFDDIKNYEMEELPVPLRHGSEFFSEWCTKSDLPENIRHGQPTSCWAGFNHYFGGARPELIILTGETGRGKTTFALNWLRDTLDQNIPGLLISLENGPIDQIEALGQMSIGHISPYSDNEKSIFGKKLEEWPLTVLDYCGPLREEYVSKAIIMACREYGTKFVVLDHLEFIQKQISTRTDAYIIDDCVRSLSGIATMNDVTIVLICHPSKRGKSSDKEIDLDELKGTSGLKQTAMSVLIHHRPNPKDDKTWIRFAKIRHRKFSASTGGRIEYSFKPQSQEYVEVAGYIDWGK